MVLDAISGIIQGNDRLCTTHPETKGLKTNPSTKEIQYQTQQLNALGWTPDQLRTKHAKEIDKGLPKR